MNFADNDTVYIYTDGSCLGNPGPGGWAALLRWRNNERKIFGGEALTTNNRMELMAVVSALEALKRPLRVQVYTDSAYVCNGANKWIDKWAANGWKNSDKKVVKNYDLWRRIHDLKNLHSVEWNWTPAHCGDPDNEYVDTLARNEAKRRASDY